MQKRMRSVKQLTMSLWEDSGLIASGNHQVIAAFEKLLFLRRGDPGPTRDRWHRATRPDRRRRGSGESLRDSDPCTSRLAGSVVSPAARPAFVL